MSEIIKSNAERMRQLHRGVKQTVSSRHQSTRELKDWQDACLLFHREYDSLAFPGGFVGGVEKIKEGHLLTIQVALEYLENTPYCFRSQYVATALKRALNKVELPERLARRLIQYKQGKFRAS